MKDFLHLVYLKFAICKNYKGDCAVIWQTVSFVKKENYFNNYIIKERGHNWMWVYNQNKTPGSKKFQRTVLELTCEKTDSVVWSSTIARSFTFVYPYSKSGGCNLITLFVLSFISSPNTYVPHTFLRNLRPERLSFKSAAWHQCYVTCAWFVRYLLSC